MLNTVKCKHKIKNASFLKVRLELPTFGFLELGFMMLDLKKLKELQKECVLIRTHIKLTKSFTN